MDIHGISVGGVYAEPDGGDGIWPLTASFADWKRENLNRVIDSKVELQMAGNLLIGISQDEHERAVFRSRRIYQSDLDSNIRTAEDRGRKEGRLDGIKDVAKGLLSIGLPISQIELTTGLTESEIRSLLS